MENCIFCKIAAGEIPCYKIYEDADFLAFLDIRPFNPGHVLVIPQEHFRWVWDVKKIGAYYEVTAKIALALKKALNTDYVVSLVMGQQVPHAHIHLIPRFANDGHEEGIDIKSSKEIPKEKMLEIMEKIKTELV